ncbi:MAG: glutamyl-tRNA reductase [Methanobacterium sp.]|uniref:glutamyl-tRNA reductase n=1 Tax=Methanobacterium sp. TaxID=2164 RepID=UPI003D646E2F|nr:glutamyl-tRNA reductase [Methanobacterium sp.]
MILNIRIDHKTADINTIEKYTRQMDEIFEKIKNKHIIDEYLQIKTCNRAELYLVLDECYFEDLDFKNLVVETDDDALKHLLMLSCGLESMIIGEDQILGQIKDSRMKSLSEKNAGNILNAIFTKAIHVGQSVRKKTNINKGSISIGSAAVELAESVHGDLKCKKVLVIGAGKMGTLVAKALVEKHLKAIVVANRTYDRATCLAKELGGSAIHFDRLDEAMSDADVIISATGAPHPILTYDKVKNAVSTGKLSTMVMVDIANPRDIEDEVKELGVKLFNIDDLRGIADKNRKMRESEAEDAMEIIEEELQLLKNSLKRLEVETLISNIRRNAEEIRTQETQKAFRMLGDMNGKEKIVNDLTQVVVDKIFSDIIKNIKNAAENDNKKFIETAECIFAREESK